MLGLGLDHDKVKGEWWSALRLFWEMAWINRQGYSKGPEYPMKAHWENTSTVKNLWSAVYSG